VLTFDDGYADNWIFAYPIMKKYGFNGTVFVNPEFADPRDILRKRIDEIESVSSLRPEDIRGFLSWREMAEAERDGVFDIQAHAMTHTWFPTSDRIIDFRHPGDNYVWMTWNANVANKPFLQVDDEDLVRLGEPVYEHGKSLSSPRFFPNEVVAEKLVEHVRSHGGREFFGDPAWKETLTEMAASLQREVDTGRYETQEEYEARVREELSGSKKIIEEKLGKKVDFMCWPGGSGTDTGVRILREIGYLMSTTADDMPVAERTKLLNLPSQGSDRIARIPAGLYWDGRMTPDSRPVYDSGFTLYLSLMAYKRINGGHVWGRLLRKMMKEYYRLKP
jgi:peptidoglycan/xylan/chitin deacetylase (PgdA/CDA1 family)